MDEELALDLERLGLSAAEARVYLVLLQSGGGYVTNVARKADVERTHTYHVLKTLAKKGLVSTTSKGAAKYYLAESPQKIVLETKERNSIVQKVVPSLFALEKTAIGKAPKVKYYEDLEGIEVLLYKSLETSTEILSYTNVWQLMQKFPKMLKKYCMEKAKKKIKSRIVSSYNKKAKSFLKEYFPKEYIEHYMQLLYVNPREFYMENEVLIYDDKVSIVSLSPAENMGVLIESSVYAETSRATFNLSWLGATRFDVL